PRRVDRLLPPSPAGGRQARSLASLGRRSAVRMSPMDEGGGGAGIRRAVVAAGGLFLLAVLFIRFQPAWTVLTRVLQPAAVAVLLSLAAGTVGHATPLGARRIFVRLAGLADEGVTPSRWVELLIGLPLY